MDNEFLGSVFAYSYLEKDVIAEDRARAKAAVEELGLDWDSFDTSISRLKKQTEAEKKYFHELVDLVAQEIVTFHTEISKREERINALNNQLGTPLQLRLR